jgi:hypothetical protein
MSARTRKLDIGYSPRPWQQVCHSGLKQFNILVLHRRAGKTTLAMAELIDAAVRCTLKLPRFGYIAPQLKQARANLWDRLKDALAEAETAGAVSFSESDLSVTFKHNRAKIRLHGAEDPDALRGMWFDGVVIDEVAQIKPVVWDEIIQPMLMDRNGWAIFIGTPKGINLFSRLYYNALKDPAWFAKRWTVYETDALPPEKVERYRLNSSPQSFAREFMCDFEAQSDDQLISLALAMEAAQREFNPRDRVITSSPTILGVDPARFGNDRSVIVRRQGLAMFEPRIYRGIDNMELAARVANQINEFRPAATFIDSGQGGGVIDRLRQLGHQVIEVPFGGRPTTAGYANRRAEMWCKMRDWLKAGGAIPHDEDFIRELATPVFWHNNKDEVVLEPKDSIKERLPDYGSPDIADAACLTWAADVATATDVFEDRLRRKPKSAGDYDPFSKAHRGHDPFGR